MCGRADAGCFSRKVLDPTGRGFCWEKWEGGFFSIREPGAGTGVRDLYLHRSKRTGQI